MGRAALVAFTAVVLPAAGSAFVSPCATPAGCLAAKVTACCLLAAEGRF